MTTVLVVPGLGNSGPDHWQSHLEAALPGCRRVALGNWDKPDLQDWVQGLERAVQDAGDDPVVLLAHSLACATVAHWSREGRVAAVKAALLVAPADVDSRDHTPPEVWGFAPMPLHRLPFPTTVVASRTDPFVAWDRAATFAEAWGADLMDAGDAGHLNTDAGYGRWDYPATWLKPLA